MPGNLRLLYVNQNYKHFALVDSRYYPDVLIFFFLDITEFYV